MTVETTPRISGRLVYEMAKRPDLQGMRAVAVLSVFADHLFGWPSGGFVGVDMFFVLSGFFITGLLIRERGNTGHLSFRNFYVRRVKRILPSALLVLTVTALSTHLLFSPARARETLLDALYAAVFASNFRFEAVGNDYFQRDLPQSPVLHYWSLSIEEQFYFLWPFLLVALFAVTRTAKRRGRLWVRQWAMFGCMTVIAAASFGWAMFQSGVDPNAAYFSTFTRIWELGVGALLAISGPWLAEIPPAIRPTLAYVGVAGVVASLFLINSAVRFPAPWAALPVLSTALIVASFHGSEVRAVWPLTNPVARYFGNTSYTLYLWHWPVITLLLVVFPKGPVFYVTAVVMSLALTAVTYRFYEDPIRKSKWLIDASESRLPGVQGWSFIGFVAAAAVVLSILGIGYNDRITSYTEESTVAALPAPLPLQPASDSPTPDLVTLPGADPCFGAPAIRNNNCALRNPDVALQPSLDDFATNDGGAPTCWTQKGQPLHSCTYGYDGPDATRIALVGDSHGSRVLVAIAPYLDAYKWRLTTYLGWGCAWASPPSDECQTAMPQIQQSLLDNHYDLVLTTASRAWGSAGSYVDAWAPVAAAGSRIAVLADNPAVSEEAINCLTRVSFGGDKTGECGTPRPEALAKRDQLMSAASRVPKATVIDLTPYYCTADRCPSVVGNVIVYSDTGAHLTATYIRTLAPAIIAGMQQALTR